MDRSTHDDLLYTFRVVSPEEAAAEVYPYILVNEDGSARELHASEREYLEARFMPNDSARPYVKAHYKSRSGWFGISGFCRRAALPAGMQVAAAPTEDPSRRLTIDDIREELRKRYEAPRAPGGPTARPETEAGARPSPAAAVRPPRPVVAPATAGQAAESRPGRMSWLAGMGFLGALAVVMLRIAVHHPLLKDWQQRQAVQPAQGGTLDGTQSTTPPGLSTEDVVRRINALRFESIVACQRRLGVSDEALDSLLKRAWRAQHPDGQAPWETEAAADGDWRTSVTWNVAAVEKALRHMAAGNDPAPAIPER